jgi:hypothetical protein
MSDKSTKKSTYFVVLGLSSGGVAMAIAGLHEKLNGCRNREHCPELAFLCSKTLEVAVHMMPIEGKFGADKELDCTTVRMANAHGKQVVVMFSHPAGLGGPVSTPVIIPYATEMIHGYKCKVVGTKREFIKLTPIDRSTSAADFFKQFYYHVHWKLGGLCYIDSNVNQARLSRIEVLEEHVNALMNSQLDPAEIVAHVAEKRLAPPGESPSKRQKSAEEPPTKDVCC